VKQSQDDEKKKADRQVWITAGVFLALAALAWWFTAGR
jgi:hypothetical protein